jgi:predicted helicase
MKGIFHPALHKTVARCSSWEDFVGRLSRLSEKEKGDVFEHLVRAYLLLDPEYATKLRSVWLLKDVPSALRKKLRLPADDQGIDLIAETNTGEYWAIQCKYREDTVRPVPWREISTFTGLAFGVCRHISFGLVCSTTERITRVLKEQDRIGFCALDVWQGLDAEFFSRLRRFLGRKPTKLVPLKPRPHQKSAITDAREHFVAKRQKRGKLISPCGSGKSLTAYWIARDLGAKKILSMDNPAIYGDTFHLLSFKRALEATPPILSDYRIVTILVSRDEITDMVRKNVFLRPDKSRWDKEFEAEMLAALVALRKAMRKYPIRHAVSFHSSIQRAEIFKDHNDAYNRSLESHAPVESFHVSGKTPTGTRARIVSEFAATERALITNARCLTEGVDVPGIDCVMFADPRRSTVDIVQAVGRALRPAKGKTMGYVIVPILHDAEAKPEDIFASGEFQEILTTLRALAANDERIIEYFRSVSEGKRRSGGGSVVFDIDEKLSKRINLQDFAREIDLKCWDRLAKLSWRPFEEARAFVRSLNLKSRTEWQKFCKGQMPEKGPLPSNIPSKPNRTYAESGWKGIGDWLGTGRVANFNKTFRPF